MQAHPHASRGDLPGRLASRETAADDGDHGSPWCHADRLAGRLRAVAAPAVRPAPRAGARPRPFLDGAPSRAFRRPTASSSVSASTSTSFGHRRVGGAVGDVRTVAPFEDLDLRLRLGMQADLAQHGARRRAATALLLLLEQLDGLIQRHAEHLGIRPERAEFVAALHVGTEAAEVGDDVLSGLGIVADQARQRQQLERALERDRVRLDRSWSARRGAASPCCPSPALRRAARTARSVR